MQDDDGDDNDNLMTWTMKTHVVDPDAKHDDGYDDVHDVDDNVKLDNDNIFLIPMPIMRKGMRAFTMMMMMAMTMITWTMINIPWISMLTIGREIWRA